MIDNLTVLVEDLQSEERVDKYLTAYFQTVSDFSITRSELKKYFDDECITLNNEVIKPSFKVKNGDQLHIRNRQVVPEVIIKEDIPLEIVYEDNDLLVINKPSGMVVHPAVGHIRGTLVNALLYHVDKLSDVNGSYRPGIVHRIDKDTSGLLVVCKNNNAHNFISSQLRHKTSKREYYAIVYGVIEHNKGRINAPIGRHPLDRQKQAVVEDGKESVTNFTVLERFNGFTLLSLQLETGRTHQIRVHMAYINHPVLGDPIYGPKKVVGNNGQYLHAKKLGFIHPTTKEYLEFDSELPQEFCEKLEELRKL